MANIKVNEDAMTMIKYFNWDIDELKSIPKIAAATNVIITDADLHRVFMTIDGIEFEMDVQGNIELSCDSDSPLL